MGAGVRLVRPLGTAVAGMALTLAGAAAQAAPTRELPISFELNQGQADPRVRFLARGSGGTLFLTPTGAVLALRAGAAVDVLRMKAVGGGAAPAVTGLDLLPGRASYFVGNDPEKWRRGIPTFAKVEYASVYPGIDMVFRGADRRFEYDFVVSPGADPRSIRLGFEGQRHTAIDAAGDVVLAVGTGEVRLRRPEIYQEKDGERLAVSGRFVVEGGGEIGFEVAAWDRTRPLVIDPVLAYSTYLGGTGVQDVAWAIATDAAGNAYVTGETTSSNFPTTPSAFDTSFSGFVNAFVSKLDPTGSTVLYSTYLGGGFNAADYGRAIAVDALGNAYVTGEADEATFPTTAGAFDTTFNAGSRDGFVTKLDPTGSSLVYSTFLGGTDSDLGLGIAVDALGNAYVSGQTWSASFPTTAGALDTALSGHADGFVTKLDPAGAALVYSTYLGGSTDFDTARSIAVDAAGSAYVTGWTGSADFPTTPGAFQTTLAPGPLFAQDAFVAKLNPSGSGLVYSTFLGGGDSDFGWSIAVDSALDAYVGGATYSSNFPTTPAAFDPTFNGGLLDGFVTKLDATGSALVYSTYIGGSDIDDGFGIAVDSLGRAHLTGDTLSKDFPVTPNAIQPVFGGNGNRDAFVTKLDAAGSALVYSTFLGGSDQEQGLGVAVDGLGSAHVAGWTSSGNFPTTPGAFDTTSNGGQDGFVVKIDDTPVRPPLDHFKLYRAAARDDGRGRPPALVTLKDQFGTLDAVVRRTRILANPAEKTHDGVVTPIHQEEAHLVGMQIRARTPSRLRVVEVTNQFGKDVLWVGPPELLLVPSAKSLAPAPPGAVPDQLDHFLCYVVVDSSVGRGHGIVVLRDQFRKEKVRVGRAVRLCNPVEKTHDDRVTPIGSREEHLTCYEIGTSRPQRPRAVTVRNQFGVEPLTAFDPETLCVPSAKRVLRRPGRD